MKNKFNTLKKYIFDNSNGEYRKETINGLFRSILEPVVSNQKIEACILLKLNDISAFNSLLKRLEFIGTNIISYSSEYKEDCSAENIWDNTEFVVVLGQRYSACLIWDYSLSSTKETSNICLLYNSKKISEISKTILENSKTDFKEILMKYAPDRRENMPLNVSVNSLATLFNEANSDIIVSENEKNTISGENETSKTAQIVAEKAKYIAHEIKNNLSIINLYSKIIEKKLENTEKEINESIQNSLINITKGSENISYLINDLRCLSTPYITEFSLKSFLLNTIMLCSEKAKKSKVELDFKDFEDINIKTDKIKLECSLINIIFNAIEASPNGGKTNLEVNVSDDLVSVCIINNGEAIPKENQTKIFEPNFTTKEKGNGLGLAICKSQMQTINGDITLEYSTEKETCFKLILHIY